MFIKLVKKNREIRMLKRELACQLWGLIVCHSLASFDSQKVSDGREGLKVEHPEDEIFIRVTGNGLQLILIHVFPDTHGEHVHTLLSGIFGGLSGLGGNVRHAVGDGDDDLSHSLSSIVDAEPPMDYIFDCVPCVSASCQVIDVFRLNGVQK